MARCEFCHGEISELQPSVLCPADRAPYHQDCWVYNQGCGVLGCHHNPQTQGFIHVSPMPVVKGQLLTPQQTTNWGTVISLLGCALVLFMCCCCLLPTFVSFLNTMGQN